MIEDEGILEREKNPFFCESWRIQNYPLTKHRMAQLEKLFGLDVESIETNFSRNEGSYPAFVAIRWGFAEMRVDEGLTATKVWLRKECYDGYGRSK